MSNKQFRCMKAPNEELPGNTAYDKACNLSFPIMASYKLDGFRCIFYEEQQRTASLKPFNNIHINEKFKPIVNYLEREMQYRPLFDGELIAPSLPFNVFSGIFRSDEMILPEDTKFYMFDGVYCNNFDEPFSDRQWYVDKAYKAFPDLIIPVEQKLLHSPDEVVSYYEEALSKTHIYQGEEHFMCDGLILRNPDGRYKKGRATYRESLMFKLKPYQSFDAKIISVVEGTNVDKKADKKINEMGYSETSRKKNDRIPGGWASGFVVLHENQQELIVSIKATLEQKKEIWQHQEQYIDKYVEYKGLMVGAKDLPRHPTMIRMRPDKD